MNSFQKPVLSLEIGSLNSVQPESSKATDTSDKITQCCFQPSSLQLLFTFLILYGSFVPTVSYHIIGLTSVALSLFQSTFESPR